MSVGDWITVVVAVLVAGGFLAWRIAERRKRRDAPPPEHSNAFRGQTHDYAEIVKARPPHTGSHG